MGTDLPSPWLGKMSADITPAEARAVLNRLHRRVEELRSALIETEVQLAAVTGCIRSVLQSLPDDETLQDPS